jgi:hypothetical protein
MSTRLITSEDLRALVAAVGLDPLVDELRRDLERACRDFDPQRTEVRARDG